MKSVTNLVNKHTVLQFAIDNLIRACGMRQPSPKYRKKELIPQVALDVLKTTLEIRSQIEMVYNERGFVSSQATDVSRLLDSICKTPDVPQRIARAIEVVNMAYAEWSEALDHVVPLPVAKLKEKRSNGGEPQ